MSDEWQIIKEWPELILQRLADAGVARIILNRPDKRNCWNRPLCLAFMESLDLIRADKSLKVVITKGAGTVYSSGLDLNFLREVSNSPLLDWDRPNLTIQIAEAVRATVLRDGIAREVPRDLLVRGFELVFVLHLCSPSCGSPA